MDMVTQTRQKHHLCNTLQNPQLGASKVDSSNPPYVTPVEYDGVVLYPNNHCHRNYAIDGLSEEPLYEVLLVDGLEGYLWKDYTQLLNVVIPKNRIYDWSVGRCLN